MKRALVGLAVVVGVAVALLWVNNRSTEDPVEVTLREIPSANGRQLEVRISNRRLRPVMIVDAELLVGTNRPESLNGALVPLIRELQRRESQTNTIAVPDSATPLVLQVGYIKTPIQFLITRQIHRILHGSAAAKVMAPPVESWGPILGRVVKAELSVAPISRPAAETLDRPEP